MTIENDPALTTVGGDTAELTVVWREVPTVLVDSVVGFVTVGDVPRVTLGAISFKGRNELPHYIPQITIAAPREALRFMAAQLLEIANQVEASHGAPADG